MCELTCMAAERNPQISDDDGSASPAAAASSGASLQQSSSGADAEAEDQSVVNASNEKSPHCLTRRRPTIVILSDLTHTLAAAVHPPSSSSVAATPAKVANLRHHRRYVHRIYVVSVCARCSACLPGCDKNTSRCAQGLTWSRDPLLIRFVTTMSARSAARRSQEFCATVGRPPPKHRCHRSQSTRICEKIEFHCSFRIYWFLKLQSFWFEEKIQIDLIIGSFY